MNYPEALLYTKDHEWIRFEGDHAFVGITEFAQKELGDIVYLDIPTLNETIKVHEVFGTVEAVKTVSDLFIPLTSKVIEVNPLIDKAPELINKDPYGQGWLIKIGEISSDGRDGLLTADRYRKLIGAR
jgi:glycine cleavage system H protein